jgi:hypothetical protein
MANFPVISIKKHLQFTAALVIVLVLALVSLLPMSVKAEQTTCTITAVACAGGSISPSGSTTLNKGDNQTYIITPDQGKAIQEIRVDNQPVEINSTFVFENVQASHKIGVSFSPYELKVVDGAADLTLNPSQFRAFPQYGVTFNDNNEALWKGLPLYILIQQLYQGESTTYTVKAVSSDPVNDIIFTNDSEYPFLDPAQRDQFMVADQY